MLDLREPTSFYRGERQIFKPYQIFICEWESIGIASIPGGVFVVESVHPIEAKQISKKVLRDSIVRSLRFRFTIRLADPVEYKQFLNAPEGKIVAKPVPLRKPVRGDKDFVDDLSTDPKSKT